MVLTFEPLDNSSVLTEGSSSSRLADHHATNYIRQGEDEEESSSRLNKRHLSSTSSSAVCSPGEEGFHLEMTFSGNADRGAERLSLCQGSRSSWLHTYISDGNEMRLRFVLNLPDTTPDGAGGGGLRRLDEEAARELFGLPLRIKHKTGKKPENIKILNDICSG